MSAALPSEETYLILGAGFVGLGMAQALKSAGIPYDQVDASDDIGGNWYHGVYETAHIISSHTITQFSHYPMPADYPDFPSARQMWEYLQAFADRFQLRSAIELNRTVQEVRPVDHNRWAVTFANGEQRRYKGVLLCNGHHWDKRMPEFVGQFDGDIIHAKDYKRPEQLRGRQVLVIGGGNSGCDIAAEAARVGAKCVLSLRQSVWFIPKTFAGIPVADLPRWWMPEWLQRWLTYGIIRLSFGRHQDYGLPTPTYRLFEKHPTLNDEVPYYLKHGRIIFKPAVQQLQGDRVRFSDGSTETIDLIICATGYHLSYPFLPPQLQRVQGAKMQCYGGAFLDDYKGLYFIGWGQARGGVGSLISAYGPVFTQLLRLQDEISVPLGLVFKQLGQQLPQTHLSDPQRVFRQLALLRLGFRWLRYQAHRIDRRHGPFQNRPLEP
ncbi:flavin-containing monooxygenase [Halomicronema hongdechloris]|nr:NAD(P)-binding domain-containing protein [Halomicronema hongdechloris]